MRTLRIGLAQINTTVGHLKGNTQKVLATLREAQAQQVDLLAFPELTLTGYPPEDLLCRVQFVEDNLACLEQVRQAVHGPMVVIVGFVDRCEDIFNAAAALQDQQIVGVYHKHLLPNYGVFDEKRYFRASTRNCVFELGPSRFGVSICEDIWFPQGPPRDQALKGEALLLVNISASPYHAGKPRQRWDMIAQRAQDYDAIVALVNLVGGQDELIFDGASGIFDATGQPIAQGRLFQEDLIIADIDLDSVSQRRSVEPRRKAVKKSMPGDSLERISLPVCPPRQTKPLCLSRPPFCLPSQEEEVYEALVLGTRDYVDKNGFRKVVVGLSGGVDSALTAVLAVDALGAERVVGVGMPSRFSSEGTQADARQVAKNLGIQLLWIPIDKLYDCYRETLDRVLGKHELGLTEENLQARIRGNLLMALSNYYGWLVLTTGNKSEASVGYCTLYGDMAGGIAVIKDVAKTMVYRLCRYRNDRAGRDLIPQSVLDRVPSAELRPNQKDSDSLPEYEVLDQILEAYVEQDRPFEEILRLGLEEAVIRDVISRVDRNEYKRRQSPPGLKISPRALGKDRRLPITNHYRIFERNSSD